MCLLSSRLKHYLEIFLTIRKMSLSKQHANLPVRGQEINKNLALSFPRLSSCRVPCRLSQRRRASWRVICSVVQSRWGFCFWSHWECQTFWLSFVEQIPYFPLLFLGCWGSKSHAFPSRAAQRTKEKLRSRKSWSRNAGSAETTGLFPATCFTKLDTCCALEVIVHVFLLSGRGDQLSTSVSSRGAKGAETKAVWSCATLWAKGSGLYTSGDLHWITFIINEWSF